MKKALTIALAGVALAATLTFVAARSRQPEPVAAADALPAYEILTRVREMGLDPIGQPVRRGPYYVLHAYDPRGVELRVVADAQLGDVLSAAPARSVNAAYAPQYDRGPRIIKVPQPGDRHDQASVPDSYMDDDEDDDGAAVAPPPRQRSKPRPQKRSDAPAAEPRRKPYNAAPPPVERRTVLSAPPPPPETSLTPIRPTPRFNAKPEDGEKFAPPPPGYTPPAALPDPDKSSSQ